MTPHCGRMDAHEPHEWITRHPIAALRRVLACPGVVVNEGGGTPLCRTCGEQNAAPQGWGQCRWCWAEREVSA